MSLLNGVNWMFPRRSCNLTWAVPMLYLSLRYDYIHCLDHPLYSLLAPGHFGIDIVSCFLDTHNPLQATRYCSGWLVWFTKRHHHAPWQNVAAVNRARILGMMSY